MEKKRKKERKKRRKRKRTPKNLRLFLPWVTRMSLHLFLLEKIV